jgi:hypothetical protein
MLGAVGIHGRQRFPVDGVPLLACLIQGPGHIHERMERQQLGDQVVVLDELPLLVLDDSTGGKKLTAASAGPGAGLAPLSAGQAQSLWGEALAHWEAAGVDTSALAGVSLRVRDLGGLTLGMVSGHTVWLDDDAAGWGWFVDRTPWEDSEFTTPGDQGEQNHMDLLTVLMHEMGHVLGLDHDADGVMQDTLPAGTRRLPTAQEAGAAVASPPGAGPAHPSPGGLLDRPFAGEGQPGLTVWEADLALLLGGRRDRRG